MGAKRDVGFTNIEGRAHAVRPYVIMSCTEISKRENLLTHIKDHVHLLCPACRTPLTTEDGAIAFGNAQMITAECKECRHEAIFVINEKGEILEASPN